MRDCVSMQIWHCLVASCGHLTTSPLHHHFTDAMVIQFWFTVRETFHHFELIGLFISFFYVLMISCKYLIIDHRIVCCENMQNQHQRQLWHSRPNTWLSPGIWLQCWCWPVTQSDTQMHQFTNAQMHQFNNALHNTVYKSDASPRMLHKLHKSLPLASSETASQIARLDPLPELRWFTLLHCCIPCGSFF